MKRVVLVPIVLLAVGVGSFVFYLASGMSRSVGFAELDAPYVIAFGIFLPMGVLLLLRRPSNPIGWLMSAIGVFVLVSSAATEYATRALVADPGSLPGGKEMAFLSALLGVPTIALLPLLMLLFPTGRMPSRRWRWVGVVAIANIILITLAQLPLWSMRGPAIMGDEPPEGLAIPTEFYEIAWFLVMGTAVASLVSLVFRFRGSSGIERQQLKWMAYVAALVGVFVVLNFFVLDPLGVDDPTLRFLGEQLLNIAVAGIPVATAIAISRYHLYEIDVVINRTLVYGVLTAILVGVYVGMVFGFQALLAPVTAESDLAVAASTLAVAGLFRPVRTRVQRFIDHRFYRRRFDAQRTLETFSGRLRDEVDLTSLSSQLTRVVADTMQPAHVSLWIRGQSR